MAGGVRFRYSNAPDLFRVGPPLVAHEYLAIVLGPNSGGMRPMTLKRYVEGTYQETIASTSIFDIDDDDFSNSVQVIVSDPSGAVAPRSVLWGDFSVYDPVADTIHEIDAGASGAIWNPSDGYIYNGSIVDGPANFALRRVRADGSGFEIIKDEFAVGTSYHQSASSYALSPAAYYAIRWPDLLRVPLDGSAPAESMIASRDLPLIRRPGLPVTGDASIYVTNGGTIAEPTTEIRAWSLIGSSTEAALWPVEWAEFEDPGTEIPGGSILSHSLNPARDEVAVYSAREYEGAGDYGIIRVGTGVQSAPPTVVPVSSEGGVYPDYMLAMD